MSDRRDNWLRAARFERPALIPMRFHVTPPCWSHYPQDALQELMADHPLLFPGFTPSADPIQPTFPPLTHSSRCSSVGTGMATLQRGGAK